MLHMRQYSPEQLVFADESGYNQFTSRRPCGWAFEGDCARRRDFFILGIEYITLLSTITISELQSSYNHLNRISLLPALSLDGIIYFIADNAGIHKAPEIRAMVEAWYMS
jgi:hypothetical protein